MTAVNLQLMPSSLPLDFLPPVPHSRPNSVSSSSSTSRPHSAHGLLIAPDDLYRSPYSLHPHPGLHPDHLSRHSPPHYPKPPLRPSHLRARVAASPYPRDTDSVHSSSSEADDIAMFLAPNDYHLYPPAPAAPPQNTILSSHDPSVLARIPVNPDQTLEKLATNVRVATTTSASDRAKQIFVQTWLSANYAPYPDGNVPRQGLYFSYRRVCDQYSIPHINTATLGKAIRLCFPTIKTRRLGVRGNSKYHYCGIRPATAAEAEYLQEYIHKSNNTAAQQSVNAARLAHEQAEAANNKFNDDRSDDEDDDDSEGLGSNIGGSKRNSLTLPHDFKPSQAIFPQDLSDKTPTANTLLSEVQSSSRPTSCFPHQTSIRRHPQSDPSALSSVSQSPQPSAESYISSQSSSLSVRQFPHFPSIDDAVGCTSSTSHHSVLAREVWGWFQDHLDALLESVRLFRFDQFEMHLRTFWANLAGPHREIVHAPAIAGLMAKADAIVYDEILEILRSQMLSPLSSAALSSLRQLANKMEKILLVALESYGNTFVEPKVELGARFGHLVLRFLDIYQVTQALNTVLTNQKQLAEMRRSWQKVDFDSVRNQSALVCNCRHEDLVQLLEVEFVTLLDSVGKSSEPVREVMSWADKCSERLMGMNSGGGNGGSVGSGHVSGGGIAGVRAAGALGSDERSTMSSRSVLIRWGYVTSQVMRDLTIRSDPAFGAFQIMKLFLDDWIAVSVLRSVALSTNSVAASVEPAMHAAAAAAAAQQYFSLSPMPGQESFGAMDVAPSATGGGPGGPQAHQPTPPQTMAMTPTTSSMLAALQGAAGDPFSTVDHHSHAAHGHPHAHAATVHHHHHHHAVHQHAHSHHAHHGGVGVGASAATAAAFGAADAYGTLGYMDTTTTAQDDVVVAAAAGGFPDFGTTSGTTTATEVGGFSTSATSTPSSSSSTTSRRGAVTSDLGMLATTTAAESVSVVAGSEMEMEHHHHHQQQMSNTNDAEMPLIQVKTEQAPGV